MARSSARAVALDALRQWRRRAGAADMIVARLFPETKLAAADRAFALELFYGVLRNLTLLDFWIRRLRRSHIDVDLRDVLRLGLYQLLLITIADHAAVHETVAAAPKRGRDLVNAILRGAIRRRDELQAHAAEQSLSVRESHPQFLITRWKRTFGTKAAADLCRWNNEPPPLYGRINQLKIGIKEFRQAYPTAEPITAGSNFFLPGGQTHSAKADEFLAPVQRGHAYVQDPSTQLACELLAPQRGEHILDACAAPGGKTSYIAELMANEGAILAIDRQPARLKLLDENLRRLGVKIAQTRQHDWKRGPLSSAPPFDRILVDAPCSNTGVMRRRVDVRWRLRPADFEKMRQEQLSILRAVVPRLKRGGVLVYSTCSLEPEENRDVVAALQKEMSILQLEEEKWSLPFRDGFDGAFVARLRKTG